MEQFAVCVSEWMCELQAVDIQIMFEVIYLHEDQLAPNVIWMICNGYR